MPQQQNEMDGAGKHDAGATLTVTFKIARCVMRDLSELRRILDRADLEEEVPWRIAGELEEFEQHLARLKEKRAEWQSRALTSLSTVTSTPRFSE